MPLEGTPVPQIVALDRILELEGIPVDPQRAERVVYDLAHRAHAEDISSRVVMRIEGATVGPEWAGVVLLARLESVAILDTKGQEFARFPADAFPSARDRAAALDKAEQDAKAAAAREKQQAALTETTRKEAAVTAAGEAKRKAADSVRKAAFAAFESAPAGPDVLGIQLGTSYADAEALIRKHMQVGWVLTNANSGKSDELDSMRIFVTPDLAEYIVLFDSPKHAREKIIGVRRYVKLDKGVSDDAIEAMLREKYGTPITADRHGGGDWGAPSNGVCRILSGIPTQLVISEGVQTDRAAAQLRGPISTIGIGVAVKDLSEFDVCRPQIHVDRVRYTSGEGYLNVGLFDMRIYATLLRPDGLEPPAASAVRIPF